MENDIAGRQLVAPVTGHASHNQAGVAGTENEAFAVSEPELERDPHEEKAQADVEWAAGRWMS